jgi:hypothetical protein
MDGLIGGTGMPWALDMQCPVRLQVLSNRFDVVHFQFNFGFFDLHELAFYEIRPFSTQAGTSSVTPRL